MKHGIAQNIERSCCKEDEKIESCAQWVARTIFLLLDSTQRKCCVVPDLHATSGPPTALLGSQLVAVAVAHRLRARNNLE